jgi:3-methyladenine DNA glycosylase AlkD
MGIPHVPRMNFAQLYVRKIMSKITKSRDCNISNLLIAQNVNEYLLCEQQLASRWGISIKTLQAQRWKGCSVAFIKLGRSVRYRLSDVVAFELANTVTWGKV